MLNSLLTSSLHLHLLRPWALYLLIPCLLCIGFYALKQKRKQSNWKTHIDPALYAYFFSDTNNQQKPKRWPILLMLSFILAIFALSGPAFRQIERPVFSQGNATLFLLDLSSSMNSNDIQPSRLVRVRFKLDDIFKHGIPGQVGLIAFSAEAFLIAPLSRDSSTLLTLLPALSTDIMPVQGPANIDKALHYAQHIIQRNGIESARLIVLTDSTPSPAAIKTAQQLTQQNIRTSVLAVGTASGAPIKDQQGNFNTDAQGHVKMAKLNSKALRELAHAGHGAFYPFVNSDLDIQHLLASPDKGHQLSQEKNKIKQWLDEGHWFILLLLPFALIGYLRRQTR
jgi:Ca-activated chloride channel family protein